MKKSLILISFILFALFICLAKDTLSIEEQQEDFLYFIEKYKETHPDPYHYLPKKDFDRKVHYFLENINSPIDIYDFWIKLAEWNSIFDGHTALLVPDNLLSYLKKHESLLFFDGMIRIKQEKLYFGDYTGMPDSLVNKEIIQINDVESGEIINNLINYISKESYIYMENHFNNWFCILYPLLYGLPKQIQVTYLENKKIKETILSMQEFLQWDSITYINKYSPRYSRFNYFYYPEQKIALFEFNNFDNTEVFDDFKKDLNNAIDSLNLYNIEHLFVDISQNRGGSDLYVFEFIDYLATTPPSMFKSKVSTKYDFQKGQFGDTLLINSYDYYKRKREKEYSGNFYLIQSNFTYSASSTFSCFVKEYGLGTIIGEETSGLTACYIDYSKSFYKLPNSGFTFICAFKAFENPGGKWDGRGVLPDTPYEIGYKYLIKSFTIEELMQFMQISK